MYDAKRLQEGLDVAVETVLSQARAARSADILTKPDFWTLGYAGGSCQFFIARAGLKAEDALHYASLVSAFGRIFDAKRAPRLASYFLTFHNASGLVSEICDFDSDEVVTHGANEKESSTGDFLQRVRGIYRTEVFDKFVSLSLSIRDVVGAGKDQAEMDMAELVSKRSPTEPKGLVQYLLSNKGR